MERRFVALIAIACGSRAGDAGKSSEYAVHMIKRTGPLEEVGGGSNGTFRGFKSDRCGGCQVEHSGTSGPNESRLHDGGGHCDRRVVVINGILYG